MCDVRSDYISLISGITADEYSRLYNYFREGNDINVSGGVFSSIQGTLIKNGCKEEWRGLLKDFLVMFKMIYKYAMDHDCIGICVYMQTVPHKRYLGLLSKLDEVPDYEFGPLKGILLSEVFDMLNSGECTEVEEVYWRRFLHVIWMVFKIISEESLYEWYGESMRSQYIDFISSIGINEFVNLTNNCLNASPAQLQVPGEMFEIMKEISCSGGSDPQGNESCRMRYIALCVLHRLASEKGFSTYSSFLESLSVFDYYEITGDLQPFMRDETDTLQGGFMQYLWSRLINKENSFEYDYFKTVLVTVFGLLRLSSVL